MAFPTFHGRKDEDASEFLDNLEMAYLVAGRDDEPTKLRAFPLVIKGEACTWFNALDEDRKATWDALKRIFLQRFGAGETPEKLWQQLSELR